MVQKRMEERLNVIDQELVGICMDVLKLTVIEETITTLVKNVERLSIQVEEQQCKIEEFESY